ncbi:MAG: DEAD/DEAH box helicase family protein [Bacteroidaceae bacterium]|nr:DEAD/DEAH box helicase family protein [Bacteroidaceae bacterium]
MIDNKGTIEVTPGVDYVNDWKDKKGNYVLDKIISSGKVIINKVVTGCGFTTYSLSNALDTILISPRLKLILNKMEQFNKNEPLCYYFNREKGYDGKQKTIDELEHEFTLYQHECKQDKRPMKILVTYDSYCALASMLERFGINISKKFNITVDESHCLIKDIKLKEYSNKSVLSTFIDRLFSYKNVLFISATPIIDYMQEIEEFKDNYVCYYELGWSNIEQVTQRTYTCNSALNAFDQIYAKYNKQQGLFDVINLPGCNALYSYEGVIFLNCVKEICGILRKYIVKKQLINPCDVTIICADNKENLKELHKVHKKLSITRTIPKMGDSHTTWTFVTRTAFEGVDFYSPSASTYVIANYNVSSLSLDIASDIPQIIGRQRRKDNPFRNTLHLFYKDNKQQLYENDFTASQNLKMQESQRQIAIWQSAPTDCKESALSIIDSYIKHNPNDLYITTTSGEPVINNLLIISERYCYDVIKNHHQWFIMSSNAYGRAYSMPVQELKDRLSKSQSLADALRVAYGYFVCADKVLETDIFIMLRNEAYNEIGYYFSNLSPDRIKACSFNSTKLDTEIANNNSYHNIAMHLPKYFEPGKVYTRKYIKEKLQEIYKNLGIKKSAKATDLNEYATCIPAKKNGERAYRIEP